MSRLLVVKLSSLGDLFHALPAVHRLKTAFNAGIDWVADERYAPLVRCFSDAADVIAFPRRAPFRRGGAFLRRLRRREYDLAVDFQGLLRSALVSRLARARFRLGPSFHREGARLFYDAIAGPRNKRRHAVDECLDAVRFLGLAPDPEPVFPVAFPAFLLDAPRPRVAMVPASRWPSKNWPADRFAAVARVLIAEVSASVFIVGGPEDAELCARVAAAAGPGATSHAGRTTLPETAALLARMDLAISNDSGPMHLAAAADTPVLALFGPTTPERTGPLGKKHRVLSADCPHRPCFRRRCRTGDRRCLAGISTADVTRIALDMLRGARPADSP